MLLQFIQKPAFKKALMLLAPIVLWAALVKNFFVQTDTYVYSYWIKYFFDGLFHGEFPLWDPFRSWGSQDIFDMRFIGEYNPFLYIAFFLDLIGLSFSSAFSVYLVIYFFVGCLGFYLLAKQFLNDERLAYLAYVLFVFSCIGVTMFTQLVIVLVMFPVLWFFYFLISFIKTAEIKYLPGITFTSMLIVTTYIPYFFLSFFLPLFFFFLSFGFITSALSPRRLRGDKGRKPVL
jgi:hypothetical protein